MAIKQNISVYLATKIIQTRLMKNLKNYLGIHLNFLIKLLNVILLLRKIVCPYEYMDQWEKFIETLPEKEDFYSNLKIEDITDLDYNHAIIFSKLIINILKIYITSKAIYLFCLRE